MNHIDPERHLIQQVLATLEKRLDVYRQATDLQLRSTTFMRHRLEEMASTLDLAHTMLAAANKTIEYLTDLLYGPSTDPIPVELLHALRARTSKLQSVRLVFDGKPQGCTVRPLGREDPVEEARIWRRLREELGGAT